MMLSLLEQGGIALAVAVLGGLYIWQQSVANVGTTKMLRDFNLVRVLKRTDTELALLGNFKSDNHKKAAVLVIQTAAMDTEALNQMLVGMSLHEILVNDIYSTFQGDVSRTVKPYKVNLIYPATERHVRKHMDQNFHMVVETKEAYRMITKPFIDSIPAENIEWVYNILEHKSETDRIIYEDTDPRNGFVLLPDFKWSDPSQVHIVLTSFLFSLLAARIALLSGNRARSIATIASGSYWCTLEVVAEHPTSRFLLLTCCMIPPGNRDASLQVLSEKFGVSASSIRMYLHYQPTYYQLHVHFSHIKMIHGAHPTCLSVLSCLALGTFSGKAVLLEDIINNLSFNSDHYKNATLSFVVGEMQHKQLFELFREKRII
ncbi:hypothetical protein KXD40_003897 [Peronospora effusa]|nr:hypothetical protein KXD40_003897 [Peronospora effusa]